MTTPNQFAAATKAIGTGSLIGSAVPTLIAGVVAGASLADGDSDMLWVAFFPLMVTLVCATIGFTIVLLPLTKYLARREAETGNAYALTGASAGGAIPVLVFLAVGGGVIGMIFAIFGTITGGSVGHFWWRWGRKAIAETTSADTAAVFE